jgi:hypothetical protein
MQCSSPSCTPLITACNNGYCQCLPGRILDCTTTAVSLPQGASTIVVETGLNFFVLDATVEEDLEYSMKLTDSTTS